MKSQVRIVLALLVVFSAGLIATSHAGESEAARTSELDIPVKVIDSGNGPADVVETDGDPDGWLGGQNLRPLPPINSGSAGTDSSGAPMMQSLLTFFLMFIGIG